MTSNNIEARQETAAAQQDLADKQRISQEAIAHNDPKALKILAATGKHDATWLHEVRVTYSDNAGSNAAQPGAVNKESYQIQKNDTLSHIAMRALPRGSSPNEIYNFVKVLAKLNHLDDPDQIKSGESLIIPAHEGRSIGVPVGPREKSSGSHEQGRNDSVNNGKNAPGSDTGAGGTASDEGDAGKKGNTADGKAPAQDGQPGTSGSGDNAKTSEGGAEQVKQSQDVKSDDKADAAIAERGVARIQNDLAEMHNLVEGRSQSELEKDIRDTLHTMNSSQIALMNEEYKKAHGTTMQEALNQEKDLSTITKDSLSTYMQGSDKVTDEDRKRLAQSAIGERNFDVYSETVRDMAPASKAELLAGDAEERLVAAFGAKNGQRALDLARFGKVSPATQIKDNTGTISDNNEGIELGLKRMSDDERRLYRIGKSLADDTFPIDEKDTAARSNMSTDEAQRARSFYKETHDALKDAGDDVELSRWEGMILHKDSGLIAGLAKHKGHFWNDSADDIAKDVENMSYSDWKDAKSNPAMRGELSNMLKGLNKSEADIDNILAIYDKKVALNDWSQASEAGKRSVIDQIEDNVHWNGNDRGAMLDAIEKMTSAEQKRYRDDESFRKSVDSKVQDAIGDGPQLDSAKAMLAQIQKGEAPKQTMKLEDAVKDTRGFFNDDEVKAYEALAKATPEEKERLKNDANYREQVLGFLGSSGEKIAMAVVEQGALRVEDRVQNEVTGIGGSADIIEALRTLKPEDVAKCKSEYARKYGTDMLQDLEGKLDSHDLAEAKRLLSRDLSAEEQYERTRMEYSSTRSGMGAWLSDNMWGSGTGAQADDAMNDYTSAIAGAHKEGNLANQSKVESVQEAAHTSIDNHKESKETAANYVKDGVIATGTLAAVVLSDGIAVPLLVGTAGGAVADVTTKKALMGQDYDMSMGQVTKDAAVGAAIGASAAIGPSEVTALLFPEKAALETAGNVVTVEAAEEGTEHAVVEGTKKAAEEAAKHADEAAEQAVHGSDQLDIPPLWKDVKGEVTPVVDATGTRTALNSATHNDGAQWVGARENQEDSFWFSPDHKVNILSDGMGGYGGGEIASDITTAEASRLYAEFPKDGTEQEVKAWLEKYVDAADAKIRQVRTEAAMGGSYRAADGTIYQPVSNDSWNQMGSTVVASAQSGDKLVIRAVGDSRAYVLRDGVLKQITHDQENLDGTLTGALGHNNFPEFYTVQLEPGDRILIASDGLETLSQDVIRSTLKASANAQEASKKLVSLVQDAGADFQDNVTAIVFDPKLPKPLWRRFLPF